LFGSQFGLFGLQTFRFGFQTGLFGLQSNLLGFQSVLFGLESFDLALQLSNASTRGFRHFVAELLELIAEISAEFVTVLFDQSRDLRELRGNVLVNILSQTEREIVEFASNLCR